MLTPHPGEMAHLLSISTQEVQSKTPEISKMFVKGRKNVTLVLKGHKTVVTNEEKFYINETGIPEWLSLVLETLTGSDRFLYGTTIHPV